MNVETGDGFGPSDAMAESLGSAGRVEGLCTSIETSEGGNR